MILSTGVLSQRRHPSKGTPHKDPLGQAFIQKAFARPLCGWAPPVRVGRNPKDVLGVDGVDLGQSEVPPHVPSEQVEVMRVGMCEVM